jgi:hypothetical protein
MVGKLFLSEIENLKVTKGKTKQKREIKNKKCNGKSAEAKKVKHRAICLAFAEPWFFLSENAYF